MISNNGIVDDVFSKTIPLGFSFCFYDENYDKIVIGSNGILTFGLDEAEATCPPGIAGENPDPGLIDEAIFAVQHDMKFDLSKNSEIYYQTIGTSPNRKFIVNFYEAENFGCDEKSNIQVVLSEFTNEIDIFIKDKPIPCPKESLLGITNKDNIKGISPPNRNKGVWGTHNEAWNFKPSGTKEPMITWLNHLNQEVGTGKNVKLCPKYNTIYTAVVHYQSCNNSELKYQDSIKVTFKDNFPAIKKDTLEICDIGNDGIENIILNEHIESILLNSPNNFNVSFYKSNSDATNQINPIINWTLPNNNPIYIRIENKQDTNCVLIHPITFKFLTTGIGNLKIQTCDTDNDNIEENFSLKNYFKNILYNYDEEQYSFYGSNADAQNETNPVDIITLTANSQIYLKINVYFGCNNIQGPIPIEFLPSPEKYDIKKIIFNGCDFNYNNYEPFDWEYNIRKENPNIPPKIKIEAFYNKEDAYDNSTQGVSIINNIYEVVYIRLKNSSGCFSVIEVQQEVNFTAVIADRSTNYICFDGLEDITVDLENYVSDMLKNNPDPSKVNYNFYASFADAEDNSNPIRSTQNIAEDGYFVKSTYFVKFNEGSKCYTIKPIIIFLVHPEPQKNAIDVCDIFNDNDENNILYIYDNDLLGDQEGNVSYFLNESDAIKNQNAIVEYNFTTNVTLYVRIESHGCVEIYPINFNMSSVPITNNIDHELDAICDDSTGFIHVNLTIYENDIYNTSSNATFTYYKSFNSQTQNFEDEITDPKKFPISETTTVYVKVNLGNSTCMAVATITLRVIKDNEITLNEANLYKCDPEHDLNEIFNLFYATDQLIEGNENLDTTQYEITYYSRKKAAEDKDANFQINNPNNFIPNSSHYIVYTRFESKLTECYHIEKINLYTVPAPKPISGEIKICDNNSNNTPDLQLNELNNIVITYENNFNFSYYISKSDAENSQNPLDDSQVYEPNQFPSKIWVRVESFEDCYDVTFVDIKFNTLTSIDISELNLTACNVNEEDFAIFNLEETLNELPNSNYSIKFFKDFETILNFGNEIADPKQFQSTNKPIQIIYAYISKDGNCPITIPLKLHSIPPPEIEILSQIKFCEEGNFNIEPKLNNENQFLFEWKDPDGKIISTKLSIKNIIPTGIYTLNITNILHPECSNTYEVEATHYNPPEIKDLIVTKYRVEVIAVGDYPMEYSYDGINWQSSNIFNNLKPGVYTFLVRYIEQTCLGKPQETIVLYIQNFITPNNDNINDYFIIKDLDIFDKESTLTIYNKYGKIIHKDKNNTELKWNGRFNGRNLPTGNYWYIVELPDGRKVTGNITIKNY